MSEIHQLLKLGDVRLHVQGAPEELPILIQEQPVEHAEVRHLHAPEALEIIEEKRFRFKSLLVYPLVFFVAFMFFYVILNFPAILAQMQGWFTKPQAQVQLGDQSAQYYVWIQGYYYAVSDIKLLDPNNDLDHDGLSNMDEFIMHTNPTVADSDRDGYPDGLEVINDKNPWGNGNITEIQKKLAAQIDTNIVANRIAYTAAAAGQTANGSVSGTNTFKYDLNKPGKLSIPRLNIQVPLVWSKDPTDFEKDLAQGVIHYPGTALPGEQGTIYVSGHSSDYIWKKDAYSQVFTKINYLTAGDDVFVEVYGLDGKTYAYRYQVVGSAIYKPDDQLQFIDNSVPKLNLSTCWPIGTSQDRIVVSATQVSL